MNVNIHGRELLLLSEKIHFKWVLSAVLESDQAKFCSVLSMISSCSGLSRLRK